MGGLISGILWYLTSNTEDQNTTFRFGHHYQVTNDMLKLEDRMNMYLIVIFLILIYELNKTAR